MYKRAVQAQIVKESETALTHTILFIFVMRLVNCTFAKIFTHFEKKDKILSTHLAKA